MKLKIIYIIFLLGFLTSCSVEHNLTQAQKHIRIAKRKGASILPDTVWQYRYKLDTVWNVKTNTFETKHLKVDSFPYSVTNTISAGMTRQERKALESYFKHMEKMMKLQNDSLAKALKAEVKKNRQNKKTERVIVRQQQMPWKMIILVCVIALAFFVLIRLKFFIK